VVATRSKERACDGCARTFRGAGRLCSRCRMTERTCPCGRAFRGDSRLCRPCQTPARTCPCGRTFRGSNTRCQRCRAAERTCPCGTVFVGTRRQCSRCLMTERTCPCGRTYRGHQTECRSCRATVRTCGCGQVYRGSALRCGHCQATTRTCPCGRTFRGISPTCNPCKWRALPATVRAAKGRQAKNARRARRLAAEIAGPVPAEVYAAVLDSGPCVYCGAPAEHVDHVRPLARGGPEHPDNLVPACADCNLGKGSRLLTEWHPARVAHGIAASPAVAREWRSLTTPPSDLT
jgi:hypothetical protein